MRRTELHVENVKRIKAVDITPKEDLVILEGKNRQGKSSVLDGIAMLLGGQKLVPEDAVRKGEEKAVVTAKVGDFVITREWKNPFQSTLKVRPADGAQVSSPQAFLEEKLSHVALEVLDFLAMNDEDRIRLFRKITGLELGDLDERYQAAYNDRRDYNRDLDQAKKARADLGELPAAPEKARSMAEIRKEYAEKEKENNNKAHVKYTIDVGGEAMERHMEAIKEYEKKLVEERRALEALEKEIKNKLEVWANMPEHNLQDLKLEMDHAEGLLKNAGMIQRAMELDGRINEAVNKAAAQNDKMQRLKDEKELKIKAAVMPIAGLEFDGEEIKYKGIHIDQTSQAEKIMIGLAIGIKEKPEIRILMVRNGSLLDKESMDTIKKVAKDNDFQVWIERVADGKGNELFIEDGELK